VLGAALEIAELTGGAFDPTLGAVTELWGFGASVWDGGLPAAQAAAQARLSTGFRRLRLEPGGWLTQPGGLRLDLSGIAKGFGVDKAADALSALGVKAFLLEVGGELHGAGLRPDGHPWWLAIDPPRPGFEADIRIALPGWSAATSGDYRRGFEAGGRRISHTFDPATGEPAEGRGGRRVASATVLDPSCMRADALATALTVMGADAGLAFADRRGVPALLILEDQDGLHVRASAAWAELEA
jgi:thiamine biosynthesis lipoprotein